MTHYDALDVDQDATQDEIKAAWRRKSSEHHPDRDGGDADKMALVNRAYEVLGDPERRAQYDATGEDTDKPPLDVVARDILLSVFKEALGRPGNVVRAARRILDQGRVKLNTQINEERMKIRHLQARRAKIRADGDNLVHLIIDQQIQAHNAQIARIEHLLEGQNVAEDLLDRYESSEEDANEGLAAFMGNVKWS